MYFAAWKDDLRRGFKLQSRILDNSGNVSCRTSSWKADPQKHKSQIVAADPLGEREKPRVPGGKPFNCPGRSWRPLPVRASAGCRGR